MSEIVVYPEDYNGRGKCHFRVAHNINPDAAAALHWNRFKWHNVQGVVSELDCQQQIAGESGDVSRGNAYFVGAHWVSLVSNPGKRCSIFYDDALALMVTDYDLATDRLSMMHGKSTEAISQIISDGLAAPSANPGKTTGPLDIPDEGAPDEGCDDDGFEAKHSEPLNGKFAALPQGLVKFECHWHEVVTGQMGNFCSLPLCSHQAWSSCGPPQHTHSFDSSLASCHFFNVKSIVVELHTRRVHSRSQMCSSGGLLGCRVPSSTFEQCGIFGASVTHLH